MKMYPVMLFYSHVLTINLARRNLFLLFCYHLSNEMMDCATGHTYCQSQHMEKPFGILYRMDE